MCQLILPIQTKSEVIIWIKEDENMKNDVRELDDEDYNDEMPIVMNSNEG